MIDIRGLSQAEEKFGFRLVRGPEGIIRTEHHEHHVNTMTRDASTRTFIKTPHTTQDYSPDLWIA